MILIFGILSWFTCFLFGVFAWVLANDDLKAMAAGRMDRTGESITKAGKIVGMINVIVCVSVLVVFGLFAVTGALFGN